MTKLKQTYSTKTADLAVNVFLSVLEPITFPQFIARIEALENCEQKSAVSKAWSMLAFGYVRKDDKTKTYVPIWNPGLTNELSIPTQEQLDEAAKVEVQRKKQTKEENTAKDGSKETPKRPQEAVQKLSVDAHYVTAIKDGTATALLCSVAVEPGSLAVIGNSLTVRIKSCGMICFHDSQTGPEIVAASNLRFYKPSEVDVITAALGFATPDDFYDSMQVEEFEMPRWPYVGFLCKVSVE